MRITNRRQLSWRLNPDIPSERPDFSKLVGIVSDHILKGVARTSERLAQLGIRHALVGALAVGAHGYPRATKGIDWLVGDEAFQLDEGGFVTIAPGVPIQFEGIPVDQFSVGKEEGHLLAALDHAIVTRGIPVISIEAVVYLKLKSPRKKDSVDVMELLRVRHLEIEAIRGYLRAHAAQLLPKFEAAVAEAQADDE